MSLIVLFPATSREPQSGWALFMALSTGRYQPGERWQKARWRRKFMLRSLVMPVKTVRLLNHLAQTAHGEALLAAQPCLPCRLHRPWLAAGLKRRHVLNAIIEHYETMDLILPAHAMKGYLSPDGWTLAALEGKNDSRYRLTLLADHSLDKEGEATLTLSDENNEALARLTFTLCHWHNYLTLFIGGLQGAKAHLPHSAIQQATKNCHGLFPKRIVLEAARSLARHAGAEQILAVSNQTHIYRSLRYRRSKEAMLFASYDAFWAESGGTPDDNGHYRLPLSVPPRPLEEIASKKRAEYRRRHALLERLHQDITTSLDAR